MSLHDVRLLPGSHFEHASRVNTAWLLALDVDRLLHFFRVTAGLPPLKAAPAYGGWESGGSGLRGEFVGHYLHAASAAAASTGNETERAALLARCDAVVRGLAECQAKLGAGGYVSAFPEAEFALTEAGKPPGPWVPYYVML